MHDPVSFGIGKKLRTEPDETSCRHYEFEPQITRQFNHVDHFRPLGSQLIHDRAHKFLGHIDSEKFQRLTFFPFNVLINNLRFAYRELIAFAPHRLDEDRQMELAAATDFKSVRAVGFTNPQADVRFFFFHQSVAQMPRSHILTFFARKRTVVDHEHHGQRRFVDIDGRQRFRIIRIRQRVADRKLIQARDGDDVTDLRALNFRTFQAVIDVKQIDFLLAFRITVQYQNRLPGLHRAPHHPSDANAPDIFVMVNGSHHDLQGSIFLALRHGNLMDQGFKQRLQTVAFIRHVQFGNTRAGSCKYNRKIELVFCGAQLDEQVENLVHDFFRPLVLAVNLIDDHDRFQFLLQGFAQHIFRLRHRPFERVDQEQHPIHHVEHAFHLTAEVGVARCVHDVDLDIMVKNSGVFSQNRDAPFAFQIVGIHYAFGDIFIGAKHAALF